MKLEEAVLFIDVDDSPSTVYTYREPHFLAAKEMGLSCLIVAEKGRKHLNRLMGDGDKVFLLDSINTPSLLELIKEITQEYDIKVVFCNAGHSSAIGQIGYIVAEVCEQIGLVYSSKESIAACNNKFLMRHLLSKSNINSVRYALCSDINSICEQAKIIGYPLIIKPPFGAGSAFIKKCNNLDELLAHYKLFTEHNRSTHMADFYGVEHDILLNDNSVYHYIPGQSVLLEEYINGLEGSVECVVNDSTVYPLIVNEKLILTEKSGTVLENLLITPPASFSPPEVAAIKQYAIECISALKLKYAIVHLEFRLSKTGPIVIEVNPRLGGLYVNSAFKDIAGINPYKLYLSILLACDNIDLTLAKGIKQVENSTQHYSMLAIYPEINGYFHGFSGINYIQSLPSVCEYSTYTSGNYVNAEVEENYLLKCWIKVNNEMDACNLYNNILHYVKPIINTCSNVE